MADLRALLLLWTWSKHFWFKSYPMQ